MKKKLLGVALMVVPFVLLAAGLANGANGGTVLDRLTALESRVTALETFVGMPSPSPSTSPSPSPSTSPSPSPSPTAAGPPIVIVFMENQEATDIVGNPNSPYLNSLIAQGTLFTNYTEGDPTGPSLPDYLEVVAGSRCGASSDSVSAGQFDASQGCGTTVWNQLEASGFSWGVFMDAMPAPCYSGTSYSNTALDTPYVLKHNPATPFASIFGDETLCAAHVLPFTSFNPNALPAVSFVAPGICNNHHGSTSTQWSDCLPKSAALYARGDSWLQTNIGPAISAGADVFITYDESDVLYAVGVGPSFAAGTTDARAFNHYSTLAGLEDAFGLARLNNASSATPLPISPRISA